MSDCYDDELYEDDDYNDGWDETDIETSYSCDVVKAGNGQLYLHEGWLTRYPGEDWGEASGWSERKLSLNELTPDCWVRCIELGRDLKPGESTHFYYEYDDETDMG